MAIAKRIEPQHTNGMRALYVASCRKSDLSRCFPMTAIATGKKKVKLPTNHLMMEERISKGTARLLADEIAAYALLSDRIDTAFHWPLTCRVYFLGRGAGTP